MARYVDGSDFLQSKLIMCISVCACKCINCDLKCLVILTTVTQITNKSSFSMRDFTWFASVILHTLGMSEQE